MTVKDLIERLKTMPPDWTVDVDRGGAYSDAKSVYTNDSLKSISISADADPDEEYAAQAAETDEGEQR